MTTTSDAGKGDRRRPRGRTTQKKFEKDYERIFGKKELPNVVQQDDKKESTK